jgi:hypothetical protein
MLTQLLEICINSITGAKTDMIKKGQIKNLNYSGLNEAKYINQLFGIVL